MDLSEDMDAVRPPSSNYGENRAAVGAIYVGHRQLSKSFRDLPRIAYQMFARPAIHTGLAFEHVASVIAHYKTGRRKLNNR